MTTFPSPGTYILRVSAKARGTYPPLWDRVADYRVEAKAVATSGGFAGLPTVWDPFLDNDAYLYAPATGTIEAGKPQLFRISIPGALGAAVKVGGQSFRLVREGTCSRAMSYRPPGRSRSRPSSRRDRAGTTA